MEMDLPIFALLLYLMIVRLAQLNVFKPVVVPDSKPVAAESVKSIQKTRKLVA